MTGYLISKRDIQPPSVNAQIDPMLCDIEDVVLDLRVGGLKVGKAARPHQQS